MSQFELHRGIFGSPCLPWYEEQWTIFSYLIDRQPRLLLAGIALLSLTAVFTLRGETLERYQTRERYHGIVYRPKRPNNFGGILSRIFAPVLFIGPYLHRNSN